MSVDESASKQTLRRVPRSTAGRDIAQIIDEDGAVIVERFLSPRQVQAFNRELDPEIEKIEAGAVNDDSFIADFHGEQTKRLTRLVSFSPTFRNDILNQDICYDICEAMFRETSGDFWVMSSQIIQIGPGNKAQLLHRDHGNYPIFHSLGPKGPEVMLNHMIALTDFTEENGATRIIPKSNHWKNFDDMGHDEQTIPAEMTAGDALILSGKVLHGGGHNRTQTFQRRALSFSFCPSYLTPEEPYVFMLDLEEVKKLPPRVQKVLGFRSQYPKDSPGLWKVDYRELADYLKL